MKVLVTGGGGFIGSHIAEYYAKQNNEVVIFDNISRATMLDKKIANTFYNVNFLRNKYKCIRFVNGDIRDFNVLKEASKKAEIILHAAAQVAVTTSLVDPRTDFDVNARGTFNVLEASRLNDSIVVYCSTNKVYGGNVNKIPIKEKCSRYLFADGEYKNGIPESFPIDLCSHSPYGCSKLAADLYAQDYAESYGLRTGVFRLSCVYGERQFGVEDQGWVAWFTIANLIDKPITIYGDGKQVRDVLYVQDLVQLFDSFIKSNVKSDVFNVGGGPKHTLSLLELLEILRSFTRKQAHVTFTDWRKADQKVYLSDISRAKKLLGWKPIITPRVGLRRLLDWAKQNLHLFN